MVVEPGFADPDALWVLGEGDDPLGGCLGLEVSLVRMGAYGEEDIVVSLCHRPDLLELVDASRDGDHPLQAGRAGALDDGVTFRSEIGEIEMTMTVDDHCGVTSST